MAARPGEDVAATLFADVHYYYEAPDSKPAHHRFDKGSYVYLFENAGQRRARLEIANHVGTADQDAFDGHLDGAHVEYSYTHTTLVTLVVDGQTGQRHSPTGSQEWHLPTFDPRNEKKYMYRLHTIDVYFWSKEDALTFVNGVRRVLPPSQITLKDEPCVPAAHPQDMSPVVQQLENTVISDPGYHHGRTRDSRTSSNSRAAPNFPGPPISATPQSYEAANFVPMAYNPAAPAAPEAIAHREKTPPPEDGAANPLVTAAASDYGQPYQQKGPAQASGYFPSALSSPYAQQFPGSPGFQSPGFQSPGFQSPPFSPNHSSQTKFPSTGFSSPPPPLTFAPPPQQANPPHQTFSGPPRQTSFSGPPEQAEAPTTQYANYTVSSAFPGPGMATPGLFSPGFPHGIGASTPGVAPAGFSSFGLVSPARQNFISPGGGGGGGGGGVAAINAHDIHQQAYRPMEGEVKKGKEREKKEEKEKPRGRLEENAGRLEKGVTGMFKKFEKKYGL